MLFKLKKSTYNTFTSSFQKSQPNKSILSNTQFSCCILNIICALLMMKDIEAMGSKTGRTFSPWQHQPCILLPSNKNRGLVANYNLGLKVIKGGNQRWPNGTRSTVPVGNALQTGTLSNVLLISTRMNFNRVHSLTKTKTRGTPRASSDVMK